MFFLISKQKDDTFPNHKQLGNYHISFDNGWTVENNYIYKGLTFSGLLNINSEQDIEQYKNVEGTFCIIHFTDSVEIIFGSKQKFPIYNTDNTITNLYNSDNIIHAKSHIILSDNDISYPNIENLKYKNLNSTDDEIFLQIDKNIESKLVNFKYDKPYKLYITGLDTLLIASYILKNKIDYELVPGEHAEMDHFTCFHRPRLMKDFWAYQTIQHYKEKQILLTGAHGDETLLRGPMQAYVFFKYFNENLVDICQQNSNLYQSKHCLKPQNLLEYEKHKDLKFSSIIELKEYILNSCRTDYQHWHLGNTLFYTPFDDLELLNLSLNLNVDIIKKQLLDGYVAKELIRKNRPGLLQLLSPLKNIDYYNNLSSIYEGKVKLEDL